MVGQDFVFGKNYRHTCLTATVSTDTCGIPCTETQTRINTSKYVHGSTCTEDCVTACMDFSTEITGVHGSICLYISTKVMGFHGFMSTEKSTVKTAVCGRTNSYNKYRRYKPIRDIGMDVVCKLRKGIIYDDALQQDS